MSKLSLEIAHEYVSERCAESLSEELLELFHLLRRIRNRIVHSGGSAGSHLIADYKQLSHDTRQSWERLTRRPLAGAVTRDGRLELQEGEIIAALAITHLLARAVNRLLVRTLSRDFWARLAIEDYRSTFPDRFAQRNRRMRRLKGFADRMYGSIGLSTDELEAALEK